MKILLVDDEIVALNALKKRIDWVKYGYTELFTAQGVEEAKSVLAQEQVDLMLCDVEMPGENGLSLIEEARKIYPRMICVMVTCHAQFEYIQRALRYGARDYILKPIDYEELDHLLSQLSQEMHKRQEKEELNVLVNQVKTKKEEENTLLSEKDSNDMRIGVVKNYIEKHIQEKFTPKELAELVHINDQYLMRIFRRETGQSILEYITERRIIIASKLLKDTDYSISFIADCVGCENYSYFTKLYKKQTGFTPREYRSQFKASSS